MEFNLMWRAIIALVLLVGGYFALIYFMDFDLLEFIQEALTNIELNWYAVGITLVFSVIAALFMLNSPFWVNSTFFTGWKLWAMILGTPLVTYPWISHILSR